MEWRTTLSPPSLRTLRTSMYASFAGRDGSAYCIHCMSIKAGRSMAHFFVKTSVSHSPYVDVRFVCDTWAFRSYT